MTICKLYSNNTFCILFKRYPHPNSLNALYNPGLVRVVHRFMRRASSASSPEVGGSRWLDGCVPAAVRTSGLPLSRGFGFIRAISIFPRTTVTTNPTSRISAMVWADGKDFNGTKTKTCIVNVWNWCSLDGLHWFVLCFKFRFVCIKNTICFVQVYF